jgi:hypothetical protein
MTQYVFGSGSLVGTPTQDAFGNAIALATPVRFGALQDVALDISFDTKMLYGSQQFPLAIGRGKGKVTGKAAMAQINGLLWGSLLFGQALTAGINADLIDTTGTLVPVTTFLITVVPPGSGVYQYDLGVMGPTGVPLVRVTSAPVTGQYMETAGAYTFAAADVGLRMYLSYNYTAASTTARVGAVQNLPMGYAPTFQADLVLPYSGKILTVSLPNCISTKLGLASKLDDFAIPSFEWDSFANAAGTVLTYSTSDA